MDKLPTNIQNDLLNTGYEFIKLHKHNNEYILTLKKVRYMNWDYKDFIRFLWVVSTNPIYNNDYQIVKLRIKC